MKTTLLVAAVSVAAFLVGGWYLFVGGDDRDANVELVGGGETPPPPTSPLDASSDDAGKRAVPAPPPAGDVIAISGVVVDPDGRSVADAVVGQLVSSVPRITTDVDGRFEFEIHKRVETIRKHGLLIDVEGPTGDRTAVRLSSEAFDDEVRIVLEPCGTLRGRVAWDGLGDLGEPLVAIFRPDRETATCCAGLLEAYHPSNGRRTLDAVFSDELDGDGAFTITSLPGSHGTVEVVVPDVGVASRDVVVTCDEVVDAGVLTVEPFLTFAGSVRTARGEPVGGAMVRLYAMPGRHTVAAAETSDDGRFEFSGLAPGRDHLVEAGAAGHRATSVSVGSASVDDLLVELRSGAEVRGRSVGVPASAWREAAVTPRGGGSPHVEMLDDGFLVTGVEGRVTLDVRVPGYAPTAVDVRDLGLTERRVVDVDLTALDQSLTGEVVDPDGAPIPQARILCVAQAPPAIRGLRSEVLSDESGAFEVLGLAEGTWRVTVMAASHASYGLSLDVPSASLRVCLDGVGVAKIAVPPDDSWAEGEAIVVAYRTERMSPRCTLDASATAGRRSDVRETSVGADPIVVTDLVPGVYRFATFAGEAAAEAFVAGEDVPLRSLSVEVSAGDAASAALPLPPRFTLRGTVRVGGRIVDACVLTLLTVTPEGGVVSSTHHTSNDGSFAFTEAWSEGRDYVVAVDHASLFGHAFEVLSTPAPGEVMDVDLDVGRRTADITTVDAGSGAPIGGVEFSVMGLTDGVLGPSDWRRSSKRAAGGLQTDAGGRATVHFDVPGRYALSVNSHEWETDGRHEIDLEQQMRVALELPVRRRALVTGRVLLPDDLAADEFDRVGPVVQAMVAERGMIGWDEVGSDDLTFRIPCERGGSLEIRLYNRMTGAVIDSVDLELGPYDEEYVVLTW